MSERSYQGATSRSSIKTNQYIQCPIFKQFQALDITLFNDMCITILFMYFWCWAILKQFQAFGITLFNDMLNTFLFTVTQHQTCGKGPVSKKEKTCCHHWQLFSISKGAFICTIPHRVVHTKAFVTPDAEH